MKGATESNRQTPEDLAFALCHEIGNLVGAVRLHAHLLDDEMGPREIALVSVELDDLSARASALLTHFRPVLSPNAGPLDSSDPAGLIRSVRVMLEDHGGRGAKLSVEPPGDLPSLRLDQEVIHQLLISLLFAAMETSEGKGFVSLRAEERAGAVAFVVEDDGPVDEDPAGWREQMMRGRPLICAVADNILSKRGGRVEATRSGDVTRVALVLPTG